MGILKEYTVKRDWMLDKHRMVESLVLNENGAEMSELSKEQCQGFLNELIPIGIADLFFFDGEKIAELAEDTAGTILGDAIKKLLGLDLLDTLQTDLSVILRNKSKDAAAADKQDEITQLEQQLEELEAKAATEHSNFDQVLPAIVETEQRINQLNNELSAKGGAWASSRENEMAKYAKLEAEIDLLEQNLREAIASSYPVVIATQYAQKVLTQLKREQGNKLKQGTINLIQQHLERLQSALQASLDQKDAEKVKKLVADEFAPSLCIDESVELVHDISDSMLMSIEASLQNALQQQQHIAGLARHLQIARDAYEGAGKNIARAPVQAVLQPIFDAITSEEQKRAQLLKVRDLHLENYKAALREAMDITRKLDKLTEHVHAGNTSLRTISYASGAKELLKDFPMKSPSKKLPNWRMLLQYHSAV